MLSWGRLGYIRDGEVMVRVRGDVSGYYNLPGEVIVSGSDSGPEMIKQAWDQGCHR